MKKRLSQALVEKLKLPSSKTQLVVSDTVEPRLYIVVGKRKKTWTALGYVDEGGKRKQKWKALGVFPELGLAEARKAAGLYALDPQAVLDRAATGSFREIADEFLKREVDGKQVTDKRGLKRTGLRSADEYRRHLRYASEIIGSKRVLDLKREDIARVMDKITDQRGARVAGQVLGSLQTMFLWYEGRKSGFHSPIVKAMMKRRVKSVPRARILSDYEMRALFTYKDDQFADLCRMLLLTGQRLSKVTNMRWADVVDGTWTIPTEPNEKGNAGTLVLPQEARDILSRQPKLDGSPFIFWGRGGKAMSGFSNRLALLQKALGDPNWTLHDLRRSARSLLSRTGVRPDHAERVLGHVIEGVEGTYDRHDYVVEKAEALARLAALVGRIANPSDDNVLHLPSGARQTI